MSFTLEYNSKFFNLNLSVLNKSLLEKGWTVKGILGQGEESTIIEIFSKKDEISQALIVPNIVEVNSLSPLTFFREFQLDRKSVV